MRTGPLHPLGLNGLASAAVALLRRTLEPCTGCHHSSILDEPLIIWLQGGPGASGTGYGNFMVRKWQPGMIFDGDTQLRPDPRRGCSDEVLRKFSV